MTSSSPGRA